MKDGRIFIQTEIVLAYYPEGTTLRGVATESLPLLSGLLTVAIKMEYTLCKPVALSFLHYYKGERKWYGFAFGMANQSLMKNLMEYFK